LGPFFDSLGRRPMIVTTYAVSGLLLVGIAWLFPLGILTAATLTVAWSAVFFVASAAASSAYLTVSETFPLEVRALAIALFYALATALGDLAAPWLFGTLIGTGNPRAIAVGYGVGGALLLIAALTAVWCGVAAERRPLEEVARPLSLAEEDDFGHRQSTVDRR